jgi:hypothetical protein
VKIQKNYRLDIWLETSSIYVYSKNSKKSLYENPKELELRNLA